MDPLIAKMHGAGNDFVVLAQAPPPAPRDAQWVRLLADRRRGIGSDGVLFLERLDAADALFRMHFFNSDGGRVSLCLNGARCVALRAVQLGWVGQSPRRFHFRTEKQSVEARVSPGTNSNASVEIWLMGTNAAPRLITIPETAGCTQAWYVDTGDPHLVLDVTAEQLESGFPERARRLRHWTEEFEAGANVHFVHRRESGSWDIRSFERGVEDETQACGSGCLSAVAALAPEAAESIRLQTVHGDELRLTPPAQPDARWRLVGPAVCSFVCEWKFPEGAS